MSETSLASLKWIVDVLCKESSTQDKFVINHEMTSTANVPASSVKDEEVCTLCQEAGFYTKNDKAINKVSTSLILGGFGAVIGGIYIITFPFVLPALRKFCLPFVPATPVQMKHVFSALNGRTGTLLDIGSGDGRIVLEAARKGFKATGVELNFWLVLYSRFAAWRHGLSSQTQFIKKDLWKTDLSKYDNIVIFGVGQMMPKLEEKLQNELPEKGHVVACRFPFPNWQPVKAIEGGPGTVWLYVKQNKPL